MYEKRTRIKASIFWLDCLCSQLKGNNWHLSSISHTGISIMFCPYKSSVWKLPACARCIPLNLLDIGWFVLFLRTKTRQTALLLLLTWIAFIDWERQSNYVASWSHSSNDMPENLVYQKLQDLDDIDIIYRVLAFGVGVIKMNYFSMS